MTTIPQQIRREMDRQGITAYRLAKLTGITPTQLGQFLHGRLAIRLDNLEKIVTALNLELRPGKAK